MKFCVSAAKKPVARKSALRKITWEDVAAVQEFNQRADAAGLKALAASLEKFEVCDSLTIAQMKKESKQLASIGTENMKALAAAFGCSVASLESMSVAEFGRRASNLIPSGMKAEASTETVVEGIIAISVLAIFILTLIPAIIMSNKVTKYEVPWMTQDMRQTFEENGKEAMTDIAIGTFDLKEWTKQIAVCKKLLKFLDTDAKKIYDPSFKVVTLEKMANELWSANETMALAGRSTGNAFNSDEERQWWMGWRSAQPKRPFATLGEHGFTVQSLIKTYDDLIELCKETNYFGQKYCTIKNGQYEAKNKDGLGFIGRIKRFFKETKQEREDRKYTELIINAKSQALRNLLWGVDWSIRTMCGDMIAIAMKTEKYIRKVEKKAEA